MLKIVEIEHLPAKSTREVTNLTTSVVLIDYRIPTREDFRELLPIRSHWRVGDWSKPPIDITFDADTGRLWTLELILQDEIIEDKTLLATELANLPTERGTPIFDLTPWSNGEWFVDVRLPLTLSWKEENNLLAVFLPPPVQVAKTCVVDDSLVFLLNGQNEIIGFQLNRITREEKGIIRWALLQNTPGYKSDPGKTTGFDTK